MNKKGIILPGEWEQIEDKAYDHHCSNSLPFDFEDDHIDPDHVLWYEDYCYKKGRRADGGHNMKQVFELINLGSIKGKKILDVGCGNGQYSLFFALLGAIAFGIDISLNAIQIGERIAAPNGVSASCFFSVQNISRTEFQDNFFDIILFIDSLHHVIKYPSVHTEILRILNKGGIVINADGQDGNFILNIGRHFTMKGKEELGDIILKPSDYSDFSQGFIVQTQEMYSLIFMNERIFRKFLRFPPARWIVCITKKFDDFILRIFPGLRKICGQRVLVLKK